MNERCGMSKKRKPFECSYNFHEAQTFAAACFIQIQVIAGFFRIYQRRCSFLRMTSIFVPIGSLLISASVIPVVFV